jgi:hypothetical protein
MYLLNGWVAKVVGAGRYDTQHNDIQLNDNQKNVFQK